MEQGVTQACSFFPVLFSVFINGLLVEVAQAGLGIELGEKGENWRVVVWRSFCGG